MAGKFFISKISTVNKNHWSGQSWVPYFLCIIIWFKKIKVLYITILESEL